MQQCDIIIGLIYIRIFYGMIFFIIFFYNFSIYYNRLSCWNIALSFDLPQPRDWFLISISTVHCG